MEEFVCAKNKEAVARLAEKTKMELNLDYIYGSLEKAAKKSYDSPDNSLGGKFASFFLVDCADGKERLFALADIDLNLFDDFDESNPWPWYDGTKESEECHFVLGVFHDDYEHIVEELEDAKSRFDVYNAMAYSDELIDIFVHAAGLSYGRHLFRPD